jgi:hypothetical protein
MKCETGDTLQWERGGKMTNLPDMASRLSFARPTQTPETRGPTFEDLVLPLPPQETSTHTYQTTQSLYRRPAPPPNRGRDKSSLGAKLETRLVLQIGSRSYFAEAGGVVHDEGVILAGLTVGRVPYPVQGCPPRRESERSSRRWADTPRVCWVRLRASHSERHRDHPVWCLTRHVLIAVPCFDHREMIDLSLVMWPTAFPAQARCVQIGEDKTRNDSTLLAAFALLSGCCRYAMPPRPAAVGLKGQCTRHTLTSKDDDRCDCLAMIRHWHVVDKHKKPVPRKSTQRAVAVGKQRHWRKLQLQAATACLSQES